MADLPLARVAAALETITERFAHEVFSPEAHAPSWSDFEWRIATAVASMQGISSLLCTGLRWRGPETWEQFLSGQRDQVASRYVEITRVLEAVDSHARSEGLAVVGLKGVALLRRRIYEGNERPMADIDLLGREGDVAQISRLLESLGFEMSSQTWRHQLFEPRGGKVPDAGRLGEHAANPIKIELHTRIQERLPIREVDITGSVWTSTPCPGINDYPSAVSLMRHLLLHAAGNMRAHALRFIQLYDIARLSSRLSAWDWDELLRANGNAEEPWWAMAPLSLLARYQPGFIAPSVIESLARRCPSLLRRLARRQRLSDVSWSNIRIHAFPGIEWCRSPSEAARFVASRIWPSRESRAELKDYAAHQSGAMQVPWYGLSHGARILRWAFSRPPRVQALLPVRAALARGCELDEL